MRHGRMLYLLLITMFLDDSVSGQSFYEELNLDVLCQNGEVRQIGLPWDCEGFVWCFVKKAFSFRCPEKLMYNQILGVCDWPSVDTNICFRNQTGILEQICRSNPWTLLPNPSNCAEYYDCQQHAKIRGFTQFLMECPYPSLFSTEKKSCQNYGDVECKERYEPKTPCEYMQYRQLPCPNPMVATEVGQCLSCEERFPSCANLLDGPNVIPGYEDTRYFMACNEERTVSLQSCVNNTVFSSATLNCV